MLRKYWMIVLSLAVIGFAGCGGEEPQTSPATTVSEPTESEPQAALREFLDAIRKGEDQAFERMLTSAARETARSLDLPMSPSRSDTAEFEIGDVEYIGEDGARVACVLSDLDANNERQSEELVWMLRREQEGWRIAGFAIALVEGQDPRALNFENVEEMRALKEARDTNQALVPEGSSDAVQR